MCTEKVTDWEFRKPASTYLSPKDLCIPYVQADETRNVPVQLLKDRGSNAFVGTQHLCVMIIIIIIITREL